MSDKTTYTHLTIISVLLAISVNTLFCQSKGEKTFYQESIFASAPFNECHASTVAETPDGLAVAYFGGTQEKNPDVCIWISINNGKGWEGPREVANGIQPDGTRYPCWNPVLFQVKDGPLLLFYKIGPNPVEWWGVLITSADNGKTWSEPQRLPAGFLGPIKNKPVMLENGMLLCPSSIESQTSWQVQMEMTPDYGKTWSKVMISQGEKNYNAIQPAILFHGGRKLQILCRSKENCIVQSRSNNNGKSWSPLRATNLPNPNSGIDAVTLADGRHLLVYNPTVVPEGKWTGDRYPLCVAVAGRNGSRWHNFATLESEPGEFSYPSVIQTKDNMVHIVYTWNRKSIRHVIINPDENSGILIFKQ